MPTLCSKHPLTHPPGLVQVGQPFPQPVRPAELAADFLLLPCAVVRGAVTHLGYECTVTADASQLPQCDFTVVIQQRG